MHTYSAHIAKVPGMLGKVAQSLGLLTRLCMRLHSMGIDVVTRFRRPVRPDGAQ